MESSEHGVESHRLATACQGTLSDADGVTDLAGACCGNRLPDGCGGSVVDRVLQTDDDAGVSDLYPDGNFEDTIGAVH